MMRLIAFLKKLKLKHVIILLTSIFIITNILLIYMDKNNHIQRTSYIKKWVPVKQMDMYDRFQTDGILDYSEENLVYLNDHASQFKEFLVQEGDLVNVGDSLYTYEFENYQGINTKLNSELNRINSEIAALEDALEKMNKKKIKQRKTQILYPDKTKAATITQNTTTAEILKEQFILEKENELAQKKAEADSIQSQLDDLTSGQDIITVESPYHGKVTMISFSLDNPIMKIESPNLHATGELLESERLIVEEGMPVQIGLKIAELKEDRELHGLISRLYEEPTEVSLKGESAYPFYVSFDDSADLEGLLQGLHVDMEITTEESLEALVIKVKYFDMQNNVWHMTRKGKLVKQPITKGIEMDDYIEIKDESLFNKDEWIAASSQTKFNDGAIFITPLKPGKAKWKEIYQNGPRKKSLLIGLLAR